MTYFFIMFGAIMLMFLIGGDKTETQIGLNDINVGDKIKIKGQTFTVKGYSPEGNMEIEKDENISYIIKIDNNFILTSHSENGIRKYISIDNFEGTVGGDYLNKIKFR